MRFNEKTGLKALWTITIHDLVTGKDIPLLNQVENHILLTGRNLVRDLLNGDNVGGLTHLAVGTSITNPTTDGSIGEVFRKTFTSRSKADGKMTYDLYLASSEGNGNTLTAVALFGGGATGVSGSGVQYNKLIHTGPLAITKTQSIAVTYTCDLFFNAG